VITRAREQETAPRPPAVGYFFAAKRASERTVQRRRLEGVRHLALDLDGTLYLGGRLFPFTVPFLAKVRELGLGRTFFTNNSSVSTAGYVKKLRALGIDAGADDVHSSTSATLAYLRAERPELKSLYVLGTPALRQEFAESNFAVMDEGKTEPDAVVIGFDTTLDYKRLCEATYWISRGKPFIATHADAVCPTDLPTVLVDCGAVCKMIEHATGRAPDVVCGKPAPGMLAGVLRRHGLEPGEVAVVGDRLYTDIAMAHAAGAVGVLVLTGETTRAQVDAAADKPDLVVENVMELAELLAGVEKSAGANGRGGLSVSRGL
jgi:HAD superfamily hydrolase (TIGR01450 family)